MLQTNPRFMAKLLEQLGGCAAIKAEFLGASQDARYKEGIRALISLWQAIQVVFRGLVVDIKPPELNFYPSFCANGFRSAFLCRITHSSCPKFLICLSDIKQMRELWIKPLQIINKWLNMVVMAIWSSSNSLFRWTKVTAWWVNEGWLLVDEINIFFQVALSVNQTLQIAPQVPFQSWRTWQSAHQGVLTVDKVQQSASLVVFLVDKMQ